MDIEFIKWMSEKAEGFEFLEGDIIDNNYIETPCLNRIYQNEFDSDDWVKNFYPLLLQRAIEGANKFHVGGFKITIRDFDIIVQDYITSEIVRIFAVNPDIDQAKESALKYVHEQEIKENK